jgi:lysophospholipase
MFQGVSTWQWRTKGLWILEHSKSDRPPVQFNPFKRKSAFVPQPHGPALLYELETNPAPAGISAFNLTTRDGKRIRYVRMKTNATPCKGTIIVFAGRNECIEKYFETIGDFAKAAFDVVVFDWRGQGDSEHLIPDRNKGYVRKFSDYRLDVEAIFDQVVLPECRPPFFVVGHSMGCLIALDAAPLLKSRVDRMVLSAPFLGIRKQPFSTSAAWWVSRVLITIGLGRMYFGGGPRVRQPFEVNKVTRDAARYDRNQSLYDRHPHLSLGGPTARWVNTSISAIRKLTRRGDSLAYRIPALVLIAAKDQVVPRDAIDNAVRFLPAAHSIIIENAAHEMLQDRDVIREQALAAIYAFLPGTGPASMRIGASTSADHFAP